MPEVPDLERQMEERVEEVVEPDAVGNLEPDCAVGILPCFALAGRERRDRFVHGDADRVEVVSELRNAPLREVRLAVADGRPSRTRTRARGLATRDIKISRLTTM